MLDADEFVALPILLILFGTSIDIVLPSKPLDGAKKLE